MTMSGHRKVDAGNSPFLFFNITLSSHETNKKEMRQVNESKDVPVHSVMAHRGVVV